MSQMISFSNPSTLGSAYTNEVESSFPIANEVVPSSPPYNSCHRTHSSGGPEQPIGLLRCSDNTNPPPQNAACTLMDSLVQAAHKKRGSDESQHDPSGPLMSRLSNSTWASELDYFHDPVAASGALMGTPCTFPSLVSSEAASRLSMEDVGMCGNPLAGLTLWTTDGLTNAGMGITGIQGQLQSNASTNLDIDCRELPGNFSLFFMPHIVEDQLAQDSRVSPESSPDDSRLQQNEQILNAPSSNIENETRWTCSDNLRSQNEFEKSLSIHSSHKRRRGSECLDAFGQTAGSDTRFEPSQSAAATKVAQRQQMDHPYALLPFDPALGSDTRSLDHAHLQHQFLCDQLGTGSMSRNQQALSCLIPPQLPDIKYETVNLGEYDMCEVSVSWHLPRLPASPDWPTDAVPVRRVFGINAGMTLFNLHRIICISMGLSDDAQASAFNHVWVLPSNNTYGGGPLTKTRASGASRIKVTTDRAVEYRHSITVSLDSRSQVVATPESVLLYVLGCVQLHVQLVGVMRNRTKQNSLIWVPRCIANGTYGTAPPPGTDWNSSAEVCSHVPSFHVDVHEINTQFIDTRFSKNTSFSRRTKMIRAEGIDEDILRCYSEPIQEFWQDPDRVRDLSIRVTRQSMGGPKRRCIEGRKVQRALEHEESCEDNSQAHESGTHSDEVITSQNTHEPTALSTQHHLGSLAWHESPVSLQGFISIPHLDATYGSDLHGDPAGSLGIPTCPSADMSMFPFMFGSDNVAYSPSCEITSALETGMHEHEENGAGTLHAFDSNEGYSPNIKGQTSDIHTSDDFRCNVEARSSHGVRRRKRIKDSITQNEDEDDSRSPLKQSSVSGNSEGNANELPLRLSNSADASKHASPSKNGMGGTDPSCFGVSKEGSCCSTNSGDYDIGDFRLLTGVLDDEATRSLLSMSPESIENVNFAAPTDEQGNVFDWSTTQQLWRSVQFALTQDGGIDMEPRNSAQTAC